MTFRISSCIISNAYSIHYLVSRIKSNLRPKNTNAIMCVGVWLFGVHLSVTALRVIMKTHTHVSNIN